MKSITLTALNKPSKKRANVGFTLIELITVLILISVMAIGITSFISLVSQSFVNVSERDELIASARFSVERLTREVRQALPNSARVLTFTNGSNTIDCLEFVPIVATTRYLNLDTLNATNSLNVIAFLDADNQAYRCTNCGDSAVVYPLTNADVYVNPSQTSGQLFAIANVSSVSGDVWQLSFNNNVQFNHTSPTERLYVVTAPVRYCLDNKTLNRISGYNLSNNLTASAYPSGSTSVLMAEQVEASFKVSDATLTRNGVVAMTFTFHRASDSSEQVVFNHEIHIANSP